ncbi:DUF6089 family protein [Segetibacter sp. 3557_3]|uniref:DUF6089 family protein n=1 Tax=Segetibacter sp. 3557_3 TaxID=2547429 RepID=UPI0014048ABD|nr:DUF6089 family protein [Segetibacter sp. 3557_3]
MKKLLLSLAFLPVGGLVKAQRTHINIFAGAANYQGELLFGVQSSKRFTLSQAKFAAGLGVEYELSNHLSLKGAITLGKIGADDKRSAIDPSRNLNFTSSITDAFAGVQYYITDPMEHLVNPYVFAGLTVFRFNPYTSDSISKKIFLQPLSTEGQGFVSGREPYKLTQLALPFGGGLKFSLTDDLRIGFEVGFRKTFTDYLDDVSTTYVDEDLLRANRGQRAVDLAFRGDELKTGATYPAAGTERGIARFKDWYYFTGISASVRLSSGEQRISRGRLGCPKI